LPGLSLLEVPLAPVPEGWLEIVQPRAQGRRSVVSGDARERSESQRGDPTLPLGQSAFAFLHNGADVGSQRMRALSAARNLFARGVSVERTTDLIWRALERSPQEPGRRAWTREDAKGIVEDLAEREPKPLRELQPRVRVIRVG
jgi:hypothetical protein